MANVRQFKRLHLISVFRGLSPNTVEEGGPVHLKCFKILRYCLEDPDLLVFSQKAQKYKRALPPPKNKIIKIIFNKKITFYQNSIIEESALKL